MGTHLPQRPKGPPPPPTEVDLTGDIKASLDSAEDRERPIFVAAVGVDGNPALSIRGSIYVYSKDQLALWVRKQDEGLAADVALNPNVMLTYYDPDQGPDATVGVRRLVLTGRAHVEPGLDDEVWATIPEFERGRDADRKGVAMLIDIDRVVGVTGSGPVNQRR